MPEPQPRSIPRAAFPAAKSASSTESVPSGACGVCRKTGPPGQSSMLSVFILVRYI